MLSKFSLKYGYFILTVLSVLLLTCSSLAAGSFTVSASPASLSVAQGFNGTSTITTSINGGFNSSVILSVWGGASVSFTPTTIPAPGNGTSRMVVTVSGSTPVGSYSILVIASGGGIWTTTSVMLRSQPAVLRSPYPRRRLW